MKTVVVASTNPVKIRAAQNGFEAMFPQETFEVSGVSVSSGVGHQPTNDGKTLQGAKTRVDEAAKAKPDADFWVGMESGVEDDEDDHMKSFSWVVITSQLGKTGEGRSGTFFLPNPVAVLIRQGLELGDADDQVFGKRNSKQENGAVGLLTGNVIDRIKIYEHAIILALIPFKNPDLYPAD